MLFGKIDLPKLDYFWKISENIGHFNKQLWRLKQKILKTLRMKSKASVVSIKRRVKQWNHNPNINNNMMTVNPLISLSWCLLNICWPKEGSKFVKFSRGKMQIGRSFLLSFKWILNTLIHNIYLFLCTLYC